MTGCRSKSDLIDRISLWGSAGQYIAGTFAVRALEPLEGLRATLDELVGPQDTRLGPEMIDLRVVHLRHRSMTLPATRRYADQFPDLLLRDDRTSCRPRATRAALAAGRALGVSRPSEPAVLDHRPCPCGIATWIVSGKSDPVGRGRRESADGAARRI